MTKTDTEQQAAGRKARRQKLAQQLPTARVKLSEAEADMRRSFNRWNKYRKRLTYLETSLDRLDREDIEEGTPSHANRS